MKQGSGCQLDGLESDGPEAKHLFFFKYTFFIWKAMHKLKTGFALGFGKENDLAGL